MTPELQDLKGSIERALGAALPTRSDLAQSVVDAMRHAVLGGGKRIRPLLTCATCEAFGQPRELAYAPACALEFIHAYSLIHDDLPAMDNDAIRHGLPAAHIAFGEANAILAGDSLHSLAFQTIAAAQHHDDSTRLAMIALLSEAAGWSGMAGGQCLDIEAEGKDLSLSQLQQLHAAKTGALIRVAVQIGVLCAHEASPSDEQFLLLAEFGDRIGLAFQVMDDVLDVTQTTDKLGKPAGSDIALNKNTFPKLLGLEQAKDMAGSLVTEGLAFLKRAKVKSKVLTQLAEMVINREY
jgi:geranylgeranyl pyrophosphate synthase